MRRIGPAAAAALAAWYAYNRNQTRRFRVRTPEVRVKHVTAPFRITQITDFHNHRNLDAYQVVSEVRAFAPRWIALTGDLISETDRDFAPALSFAEVLAATEIPVLYVTGNHEHQNPRKDAFLSALAQTGVRRIGGDVTEFPEAVVAGIDYPAAESLMPEIPVTDKPVIFLAHSPTDLKTVRVTADLILCGHTHGGQVRLPGIGAIVVPSEGFFAPVSKGLYSTEHGPMYIDSGIGNTRLDLRAFNPIQFTNMSIIAHR